VLTIRYYRLNNHPSNQFPMAVRCCWTCLEYSSQLYYNKALVLMIPTVFISICFYRPSGVVIVRLISIDRVLHVKISYFCSVDVVYRFSFTPLKPGFACDPAIMHWFLTTMVALSQRMVWLTMCRSGPATDVRLKRCGNSSIPAFSYKPPYPSYSTVILENLIRCAH
jgi:hypothetical protein